MDKELQQLHDLARAKLLDLREYYKANEPKNSNLKRVRKALSNLDLAPELYGDIIENTSSTNFDPKELTKAIRNHEEATMNAFKLLQDDTIHHIVQQRTGGDSLATAKGDVVRGAVKRLQDRGIYLGNTSGPGRNVTADTSLSNFAHKSDSTQKGLEKASGIGKNPNKATTAHSSGTSGFSKSFTPEQLADEESLAKALTESAEAQKKAALVGINTDKPRQTMIRDLVGDPLAYGNAATAQDVANTKAKIPSIKTNDILDSYRQLTRNQFLQPPKSLLSALPVVGLGFGALDTAERTTKAAKTKDPLDATQATLAGAGMTPVVGNIADIANTAIDAVRWLANPLTRTNLNKGASKAFTGAHTGRY